MSAMRRPEVTEAVWTAASRESEHQSSVRQAVLPDMRRQAAGANVNLGSISWMIGQGGMAALHGLLNPRCWVLPAPWRATTAPSNPCERRRPPAGS